MHRGRCRAPHSVVALRICWVGGKRAISSSFVRGELLAATCDVISCFFLASCVLIRLLRGTLSVLRPEAQHLSPALGLVATSSNAFVGNIRRCGVQTDGFGWGLAPSSALAKEVLLHTTGRNLSLICDACFSYFTSEHAATPSP